MRRIVLGVPFLVLLLPICFAQAPSSGTAIHPLQVSVCQLIKNPKNYDRSWIRVHGQASLEFEAFLLYDSGCDSSRLPGLWLSLGGDHNEIATFCCGNPRRKKGVDIEVKGQKIPLVRDEALHEFLRLLQSKRIRRPDGKHCESAECDFYGPVTATVTGFFLAGRDSATNPGYGHLGCCHLVIIQEVSDDVSAERRPVPAGGQFHCSKEDWSIKPPDAISLVNLLNCVSSQDQACDADRRRAFAQIAFHWNDAVNTNAGHVQVYGDMNGDTIANWVSADLLTSYFTTAGGVSSQRHLSATREVCLPVSAELGPKVASEPVSCQDFELSWDQDEGVAHEVDQMLEKEDFAGADTEIAKSAKNLLSHGDQSWRRQDAQGAAWYAIQEQARRWKLRSDPELRLEVCEDVSVTDQTSQISWCEGFSPDGMQAVSVSLEKHPKPGKDDLTARDIPWSVRTVSATTCRAGSN